MNHLERQLHQQGKKIKSLAQELDDIKQRYSELQFKLNQEEEKNKILQSDLDKYTQMKYEQRRQIQFLESQRDNLLEQLKSLHEYNSSMFNLQHNNSFNKMRTVQQLTLTQDELQKSQQQLLRLQSENVELRSKVQELMLTNQQQNEQIQVYPQQIENLRQKYIQLLSERDLQILQLAEKIEQLRKDQQIKEEKCQKIEFEESDITEDTNSNQDGNLFQQTLIDNAETIKTMKKSDEEKQKTILHLSEQVTLLQIENSKQRQLYTSQQITKLYPQEIQLQIRRIQQLRSILPQFTTKIAILQMKQQEINQLRQRTQDLENELKYQQKELTKYKQKYQNKKRKLGDIKEQFSNVLSENWKIKEKLLDIIKNEQQVEQLLQNLSKELCFDEYPFESLDELLNSYNKIKMKLLNQSEQKHMRLL
ncbi:unnamed protein product [Paramecium sonneborni]|uniref:Uncharacterized protein n=1 Tax=Paramecium sonneborni TaxID=65129 RepID=A0A8S1NP47_9CILI|nr:unnamed protein product [Paramecium sonneborni]